MDLPSWRQSILDKKEIPSAVIALVNEAIHAGWWIQDNQTFEWYTPDEFKSNWERLYVEMRKGGDNIKRFSIRDPLMGEMALKKKMRDAMAEYLKFRNRISEYFILELKRKK